jgi:hypothetical protein
VAQDDRAARQALGARGADEVVFITSIRLPRITRPIVATLMMVSSTIGSTM